MKQHSIHNGGFGPPSPYYRRKRQRTALSLIASLGLVLCTAVALTIVSIGIAQAEILVAAQKGDGSLAVLFLVCSIVIGAIVGAFYQRKHQRPH